jgi:protein SCO1/2/putative membrane protein
MRRSRLCWPFLALLCVSAISCQGGAEPDDLGPVGAFELTERSGRTISADDLKGKVWIASFQFTRCTAGCPQVSETMQRLQRELAGRSDVVLVTFTVDPKYDKLDELRAYAKRYDADPERWLFLTGEEADIYQLMTKSFKLPAPQRTGESAIDHPFKLVLVDRNGHVRARVDRQGRTKGYFDGRPGDVPNMVKDETERAEARAFLEADFEAGLRDLVRQVDVLRQPAFLPRDIPRFNAQLNALSAVLLLVGYAAIRRRLIRLHAACMLSAIVVSTVFLSSYLYFHIIIKGSKATRFTEQAVSAPEWAYYVYMGVLGTHTVLAIFAAPMALITAYLGLRNRLARHVRLARWTLPIWVYVSVTGVVVYVMLYRLFAEG